MVGIIEPIHGLYLNSAFLGACRVKFLIEPIHGLYLNFIILSCKTQSVKNWTDTWVVFKSIWICRGICITPNWTDTWVVFKSRLTNNWTRWRSIEPIHGLYLNDSPRELSFASSSIEPIHGLYLNFQETSLPFIFMVIEPIHGLYLNQKIGK